MIRWLDYGTAWVALLCVAAWAILRFWVGTPDIWPGIVIAALIGMGSWAGGTDE
jgi:hypothetical protein